MDLGYDIIEISSESEYEEEEDTDSFGSEYDLEDLEEAGWIEQFQAELQ